MKKFFFLLILITILGASSAIAARGDYSGFFDVDMSQEFPNLDDVYKEYKEKTDIYNWKYKTQWTIGDVFDEAFRMTISSYGSSDRRVRHEEEEHYKIIFSDLPEEYYQYLGPYLHHAQNVPESILNIPQIMATKNKFPTRIAEKVKNIEGLEHLSPHLYFLLMPELWGEVTSTEEKPPRKKEKPVIAKYNPDFFKQVAADVSEDKYLPDAKFEVPLRSKLRSLNVTKNSPITMADIKAFSSTIVGANDFGRSHENLPKIVSAGMMIDYLYEKENPNSPLSSYKNLVNPCQRVAQRIRYAGLETKFTKEVLNKTGFNLETWAYTCDKTVKAYRISKISNAQLSAFVSLKNGALDKYVLESSTDLISNNIFALMEGFVKMYNAPKEDIKEVMNYNDLNSDINDNLTKINGLLIDSPIYR